MDFELSPEMSELQATVRRLAQEKVKPRAREIDETQEYPQDLFDVFREAGLLGLVVPPEYGGSGGGILGLTLAIEEVAKYSNTAALMLLLTRLPTGPLLIAGSEEQKDHYVRGVAEGTMRAGFGLSEAGAGSDVAGMRTKAVQDGSDWVITGTADFNKDGALDFVPGTFAYPPPNMHPAQLLQGGGDGNFDVKRSVLYCRFSSKPPMDASREIDDISFKLLRLQRTF